MLSGLIKSMPVKKEKSLRTTDGPTELVWMKWADRCLFRKAGD